MDHVVLVCRSLEQYWHLAYRPYATTNSVTTTVDRLPFGSLPPKGEVTPTEGDGLADSIPPKARHSAMPARLAPDQRIFQCCMILQRSRNTRGVSSACAIADIFVSPGLGDASAVRALGK
ncbi:hypothetical protein U1Q18_031335, partial [Sarracenia purpurea var. burkii]